MGSKEHFESTSEIQLAANQFIDDPSNTMSTIYPRKKMEKKQPKRTPNKVEEEKTEKNNNNNIKIEQNNNIKLILPTSSKMAENIKLCHLRRDTLLIDQMNDSSLSFSEQNHHEIARAPARARCW